MGMANSGLLNPSLASNPELGRLTINNSYTETNNTRINILVLMGFVSLARRGFQPYRTLNSPQSGIHLIDKY
jgi:hypothetical protein